MCSIVRQIGYLSLKGSDLVRIGSSQIDGRAESSVASVQAKEQKSGQALVDEIADRIRQQIMSGDIPIGAQLRQAALAAEFGVSRTPVREALRQLQSGGLITVVPNRGAVVHVPSPWDVRDAYDVRAELEGLAAERAATRISDDQLDRLRKAQETMRKASEKPVAPRQNAGPAQTTIANDEIHTTIHEAARNPWLAKMIIQVNESFPRNVLSLVLAETPSRGARTSASTTRSSTRWRRATARRPATRCAVTSSTPASSSPAGTRSARRRCSGPRRGEPRRGDEVQVGAGRAGCEVRQRLPDRRCELEAVP